MKNLIIPSLIVLLSAVASARGAANAAAAGHLGGPALPPQSLPSANANATAQGNMGGVDRPANTGVNSNAMTHASAAGQANGLSVATRVSGGAAATLDVDSTVRSIRSASFETRDTVASDMKDRLDASEKLMAQLKTESKDADDQSRDAFAKAEIEARAKAKQVRADLKAATKGTNASSWGEVQSSLAADYGSYG